MFDVSADEIVAVLVVIFLVMVMAVAFWWMRQ